MRAWPCRLRTALLWLDISNSLISKTICSCITAGGEQDTDEIGFEAGMMVRVLEKKGEWWKGTVKGKTGL